MSCPYHNTLKLATGAAIAVAAIAASYYLLSDKKSCKCNGNKKDCQCNKDSCCCGGSSTEEKKDTVLKLPVVEFEAFFSKDKDPERYARECQKVADALHDFGLVVLRDPRVSEADNNRFIDMMEQYFESSDGVRDARPQYNYQVGVTPDNVEKPRDHCRFMAAYGPDDKPLSPCPPELDPKWRFFWRTGPLPEHTEFPIMNMDQVIPPEFPQWKDVMDMWGGKMTAACFTLAEMAAVGFNMDPHAFTSRMQYGPHLLAPTGSNFNKFGDLGRVLAGFHYDLNFMTIHGKSRFPGLYVWTREGKKVAVTVPDGCLLVQAGKQLEHLTGGYVLAGFHEVVVTPATRKVIEAKQQKNESLWRVSSTTFSHIASDQVLTPLAPFDTPGAQEKFPPIKTGHMVQKELEAISLARGNK